MANRQRQPLHAVLVAHNFDERSVVLTETMPEAAVDAALRDAFGLRGDPRPLRGLRLRIDADPNPNPNANPNANTNPSNTNNEEGEGEEEQQAEHDVAVAELRQGDAGRSLRARFQRRWRSFDPDVHLRNPTFLGVDALLNTVDACAQGRRPGPIKIMETTFTFWPWGTYFGVSGRRAHLAGYPASWQGELHEVALLRNWIAQRGLESMEIWRRERWYHIGSYKQVYMILRPPRDDAAGDARFLSLAVISASHNLALDLPAQDAQGRAYVYELVFGRAPPRKTVGGAVADAVAKELTGFARVLALQAGFLAGVLCRVAVVVGICLAFGNAVSAAALRSAYEQFHHAFVQGPLFLLYRNGPRIEIHGLGLGFWEGRAAADVCAALTKTSAGFWAGQADREQECDLLIAARGTAFVRSCEAVAFIAFAYYVVVHLVLPEMRAVVRGTRPAVRTK